MTNISPINPPTIHETDNRITWENLADSSQALALSSHAKKHNTISLIITSNVQEANRLQRELNFFLAGDDTKVLYFPDWETLAFDHFSPHSDIIAQRLTTLHRTTQLKKGIIIAALPTLLQRVIPKSYLYAHAFIIKKGDNISLDDLSRQLTDAGYRRVDQVREHGEYAIRGSIWDIFPTSVTLPFRIELFDNEIESIRSFDTETQLSIEQFTEVEMLPAREYPLTKDAITLFRQQFRAQFTGNPKESAIYESISEGTPFSGGEYYLPLFFNELTNFFEYLPANTILFLPNDISEKIASCWQKIDNRHEQLRYDISRPLCEPAQLYLNQDEFFTKIRSFRQVRLTEKMISSKSGYIDFDTHALPDLTISPRSKKPLEKLEDFCKKFTGNIVFTTESLGRQETLLDMLRSIKLYPKLLERSFDQIKPTDSKHLITVAPLDHGFIIKSAARCLIPESALFGEQVMQRRLRKEQNVDPNNIIRSLCELKPGSPIVHHTYGIGRYYGLETIKTGEMDAEYLHLKYADDDSIYVPITALHLISRYSGVDAESVQLNKLGNQRWGKAKSTALKQIRDTAAELLKLYGKRKATAGFAYPEPDCAYQTFRSAFPFEETPDQTKTIDQVISDMTQPHSMDRLVCGDVGFGKTEIAMQAAFLAANNHKQVAILAPTTLLAEQHYHNFKDRFADWPIKIGVLTRLQTKKNQDATITDIEAGKVDIVIGTHKLLQNTIQFKDLGLLIIDEEHRFGVRQKERIKELRANIDILTLTATPIPRTLNMSLSGTRDLSIISTPPLKRLSIKTFLYENNKGIIHEAISREIMRGGQVYFLHNDVATIQATADKLKKIVPAARIQVAHGQMRERELENIMSDFYHQRANVLICTTIIESGIDIPSANTIIIDRADKFGLAQLHQLRGRVGRSHHQAYAYLLVPNKKMLTKDAQKRLEAITLFENLGSGYLLATHDLEIRGAGELLGEGQSGHMHAIGFSLYMMLLDEAVTALKAGKEPNTGIDAEPDVSEVDLHVSALLPKEYIPDISMRLNLYKQLSECHSEEEIIKFKADIIDRFGTLPKETENLLASSKLALIAKSMGIDKIDLQKEYGYLHFGNQPKIDPSKLVTLIQNEFKTYQLQGKEKLRFKLSSKETPERIDQVLNLINIIAQEEKIG